MHLEQFDARGDDEHVRACHEIYRAAAGVDDPQTPPMSARCFAGWMALGWSEDPSQAWLASNSAGQAIGWYVLTLPQRENRHLARVSPMVRCDLRRAGLGGRLVRHAAERAHDQGRRFLSANTRQGGPGDGFARALGARQGFIDVRRLLRVDELPAEHLASLRERAGKAAPGYTLTWWEGAVPADTVDAVAAINDHAGDMPRDAAHESQRWDAERVRQSSRRVAAQGLRLYTVAAWCQATGEMAGMTQLGVDPAYPSWGFQELTVVARPHRGHRLGLGVKVAMLDLLAEREPQLTSIITGNSDDNKHMIAINEALGFAVLDRWLFFEVEVARVLALPAAPVSARSGRTGRNGETATERHVIEPMGNG